jgi:hypothetical protein
MLNDFIVLHSVEIEDRGVGKGVDRFKVVKEGHERNEKEYHYLKFDKGNVYKGADRTEIGQFLMDNGYLELK